MTTNGLSEQQLQCIEDEAKGLGVLKQYRAMLKRGESPRMAIMLLSRRFPGLFGTDTKLQKLERERISHDYTDEDMAKIHKLAKAAGVDTAGKTYNGKLGRYGDQSAWISDASDIRKAAKAKGLSLTGQVNVENEPLPVVRKRLSDRIVNETARAVLEASPKMAEKVKRRPSAINEVKEHIIEKHGSRG